MHMELRWKQGGRGKKTLSHTLDTKINQGKGFPIPNPFSLSSKATTRYHLIPQPIYSFDVWANLARGSGMKRKYSFFVLVNKRMDGWMRRRKMPFNSNGKQTDGKSNHGELSRRIRRIYQCTSKENKQKKRKTPPVCLCNVCFIQ